MNTPTPPVFLHDRELAPLGLWTPQNNRIQTMHLTVDELAAMNAAQHGWEYFSSGAWVLSSGHHFAGDLIYRAKPAPVTQDVVPWEATRENVMALIGEYLDEVSRLQQRPQPAATGAVTEPLAKGTRYWVVIGPKGQVLHDHHMWEGDSYDLKALKEGRVFLTEASAVAHAKRMAGGV